MLSEIKTLRHRLYINHLVLYKDKLITCSSDNTIKIWNQKGEDIEPIITLEGHRNAVTYMVVYRDKLISGSWDNTIKIWDLNLKGDTKCIKTLEGHSNYINYMLIYQDKLISSSFDDTIKIWGLKGDNKCIKTLEGHINLINHMIIYKDKLISCSWDGTIKIWDLNLKGEDTKCIKTLKGYSSYIIYVTIYKDKLIASSTDNTIKICDLNMNLNLIGDTEPIKTLEGHKDWIRCIVVYKDKLISCSDDKTIKIWELQGDNNKCIKTLKNHNDWVKYLVVYDDKLLSCSDDKTIKIWNLNLSGEGDNMEKSVETYIIFAYNILFYHGYLYGCSPGEIKILKYQPYFEDYQKAVLTIFKIMNSSYISYKNKLYKGKFYLREVNLLMNQFDKYNTSTANTSYRNSNPSSRNSISNLAHMNIDETEHGDVVIPTGGFTHELSSMIFGVDAIRVRSSTILSNEEAEGEVRAYIEEDEEEERSNNSSGSSDSSFTIADYYTINHSISNMANTNTNTNAVITNTTTETPIRSHLDFID